MTVTVLYEHPTWQRPLFDALEARGVPFTPFDLKSATVDALAPPPSRLIFSQASPSAYTADGRRVFQDMNANSNLRRPIGEAMGFDPFDRVAAWLERELARTGR